MKISSEGDIGIAIVNGKFCITKGYEDKEIEVSENIENCVIPIRITDVILPNNYFKMDEGSTETLSVTIEPENATNKNLEWIISDNSVLSVQDGVITAISEGLATITLKTTDKSNIERKVDVAVGYAYKNGIMMAKDNCIIEIFEVGKYETRKNHKLLIEVLKELKSKYKFHLSIAGECASHFQQKYYEELVSYIKENEMEDMVTLYKNLTKEEMDIRYKESDLFIIPSTKEPASISQLEAMAYSLPIICSEKNGTACYVENEKNGYLFKDNDFDSLKQVVEKIISNKNNMKNMGREGYKLILERYQFSSYYKGIVNIIQGFDEEW